MPPRNNTNNNNKFNDDDLISGYQPPTTRNNLPPPLSSGGGGILQGSVVVANNYQHHEQKTSSATARRTTTPPPPPQQQQARSSTPHQTSLSSVSSKTQSASTAAATSNKKPSFHVIPPGTSEEALKALCVRLVKDKMQLERKILELQELLRKEEQIVAGLQTKFTALASTTVVMTDNYHQLRRAGVPSKNYNDDDDHHHHNQPQKEQSHHSTTSAAHQEAEGAGGTVSNFFKSVIDRASTLPTLNQQQKPQTEQTNIINPTSSKFSHGNMALTAEEWSTQCDELLNLNQDLHMQLFEVKQSCDTKIKEIQKNASKKETRLQAEVDSLREQLNITQENLESQVKRVTEQEAKFEQAKDAVKQFKWMNQRLSEVERGTTTRFGGGDDIGRTTMTKTLSTVGNQKENEEEEDIMIQSKINGNKWRAASRAFANVLEAMIRKIELSHHHSSSSSNLNSPTTSGASSTRHMTTESKIAFQLQTLLQQWCNLEDIHEQVSSSSSSTASSSSLLPTLQRTKASMMHVVRNCSSFVLPILMKQISHCFHHHPTKKSTNNDDPQSSQKDSSSFATSNFDPASPEIISCVISSLQDCCDSVSGWLTTTTTNNSSPTSKMMVLPTSSKYAMERFCEWMFLAIGKKKNSSTTSNNENDDDEEDNDEYSLSLISSTERSFLRIIEELVNSLLELPCSSPLLTSKNNSTNNNQTDRITRNSSSATKRKTTTSSSSSSLSRQLMLQSDPQHIYLMPTTSSPVNSPECDGQGDINDEEAQLLRYLKKNSRSSGKQKKTIINNKLVEAENNTSSSNKHQVVPQNHHHSHHHVDRLLRQALLDSDALIVQKEQLLLERRDLTVRCDALLESNKKLSHQLKHSEAEYQDTVETLHKQIEILSEALTESHTGNVRANAAASSQNFVEDDDDDENDEFLFDDDDQDEFREGDMMRRLDSVAAELDNDDDDEDQYVRERNELQRAKMTSPNLQRRNQLLLSSGSRSRGRKKKILDGDALLEAYDEKKKKR